MSVLSGSAPSWLKHQGPPALQEKPAHGGSQNHEGERQGEEAERREGDDGKEEQRGVTQSPSSDAEHRFRDDGDDDRLDAVE